MLNISKGNSLHYYLQRFSRSPTILSCRLWKNNCNISFTHCPYMCSHFYASGGSMRNHTQPRSCCEFKNVGNLICRANLPKCTDFSFHLAYIIFIPMANFLIYLYILLYLQWFKKSANATAFIVAFNGRRDNCG